VGKIDVAEGVQIAMKTIDVTKAVSEAYRALPPKAERKAVDYAKAAGLQEGTPGYQAFELIDAVDEALED
jgi:hypothetical protein